MNFKILKCVFLIIISFLLLQSCSIERKLANEFVKNNNKGNILLMNPYYLFKNNLRDITDNKLKTIDEQSKDSLLMQKSLFLKHIDNEIFLDKYFVTLKNELLNMEFTIYEESATDTFLLSVQPAWILNPAQFQLEEETEPFTDYHYFDTSLYTRSFKLNKVSLHTWLELSPLNPDNKKMEILYSVQSVKDKINGKFKRHLIWGDVDYSYSIVPVNVSHVYDISEYSASKHATFLFDYIMNNYINDNMPYNWKQTKYFNYNFKKRRLNNYKEGFIIIK